DRNAGFSRANRQRLYLPVITDPEYHYETVNVEAQQGNPHSIFSWTKRLIALRKRHRAFGRGTLELLRPENRKVLAYVRSYESEQILCVANLSRFLQALELDLTKWKGLVPVELFSSNEMPVDGDPDTYMLPIAYANPAEASHIIERWPHAGIAWARNPGEEARGLLYDALGPANFAEAMLGSIARHKRAAGGAGTLVGSTTRAFARLRGPETVRLEAQLSIAEQSNNSVIFGERLMLKVFRRLEEGVNPELEVGRFLTEKTNFSQIAPLAGTLE